MVRRTLLALGLLACGGCGIVAGVAGVAGAGLLWFVARPKAIPGPSETELDYYHRILSPDGRHCAAILIEMTPWEWRRTLAIGTVLPEGRIKWRTAFDEPWPDMSVLDYQWKSATKLVVECVDNTWFGLPDRLEIPGADVTVVFDPP